MPPLAQSAWLKLPKSQRGNWTYTQYKNWVNKTNAIRATQRRIAPYVATAPTTTVNVGAPPKGYTYTPFVPTSHAKDVFPGFMPIGDDALRAQAKSLVDAQINPLLANVRTTFDARAKQGTAAINKYASDLGTSLQSLAPAVTHIADQQIAQQQAVDQGISDFVKANAAQLGNATAGTFDNPALALQARSLTSAMGAGQGLTNAGDTSAGLTQALADKATNQTFAALQPGLARNYGQSQLADYQAKLAQDETSAIGDITQQVPGLISNMYQNLLDRELTKAQTRQQLISNAQDRDLDVYKTNQTGRQQAAADALSRWQNRYTVASDNADRNLTRWTTLMSLSGADANLSAGAGHLVDGQGNPIYDSSGNPIPFTDPSATTTDPNGLTPSQLQARVDKIDNTAYQLGLKLIHNVNPVTGFTETTPNNIAYGQIFSTYQNAFPDKSLSWLLIKTRAALVRAGYMKAQTDPRLDPAYWNQRKQVPTGNSFKNAPLPGQKPPGSGNKGGTAADKTPGHKNPATGDFSGRNSMDPNRSGGGDFGTGLTPEQHKRLTTEAQYRADSAARGHVYMGPGKSRNYTPAEAYKMALEAAQHAADGKLTKAEIEHIAHQAVSRMHP